MTLTIELDPETDARLREEAERRQMEASELARKLIEGGLPQKPKFDWESATIEERKKAFHDMLERLKRFDGPPLSDEALRRENIYEDRV